MSADPSRESRRAAALTFLVSACLVSPARAQPYEATATATRDALDSMQSRSAVAREEAERHAPSNAGDMLEVGDGLVVQRTSSASAMPIVRGLTGYRVLLTVDELRLNDALTRAGGSALLNLVDPESIARIEVIRGPASVVHGSDALGGVVHTTTHQADATPGRTPAADATAYARGASAERALRLQGGAHTVFGGAGMRASFGRGHAGRLERGGDLGAQPYTGHDDWSFASRLEVAPSRDHHLALAHQSGHLFDVPRSDVSTPDSVELTKQLDRDAAVLSYSGRFANHTLRLRAFAGLALRREHRQRLRVDETRDERDRVLSYQAGASVTGQPWPRASLELGADMVLDDVGSGTETRQPAAATTRTRGRYLDASRYDTYGLYALLSQGMGPAVTLLAGTRLSLTSARAPRDPLFEPARAAELQLDRRSLGVAGSVGVRYDVRPELSWMTSFLSGFRAPNLEDYQALGGGARGFSVPNPELGDERSYTLETGVRRRGPWELEAYLFGTLLDGLVVRVPGSLDGMTEVDGRPVQTRDNASHGVLVGGELGVAHRFDVGLFAGVAAVATFGRTTRPDPGGAEVTEPASKVPPPSGALRLGFEPPGGRYWVLATLAASLPQSELSESDRDDVRICEDGPDACTRVDGYAVTSVRAGLALDDALQLSLAVENLFDAAYKSYASGAAAPGRNLVVGVRGRL